MDDAYPEHIITICEQQGLHVVRVTVYELEPNTVEDGSDLMDLKATAGLVGLQLTAFRDLRRDRSRSFPKAYGSARKPMWSRTEVMRWLEASRR